MSKKKASRTRQPRALARLLRRLHHPALRLLRRPLRLQPVRQEEADPTRRGHAVCLHSPRHLRRPLEDATHSPRSTRAASTDAPPAAPTPPLPINQHGDARTDQSSSHQAPRKRGRRWPHPSRQHHHAHHAGRPRHLAPRSGFFPSGSAEVRSASIAMLAILATTLPPGPLRIEGHTDNVPIHTAQFASNWELSTARATAIARLLLEHGPINPAQSLRRRLRRVPPRRLQRHRRRPHAEPPRRHHPFATPSTFTMIRFDRCPSNSA